MKTTINYYALIFTLAVLTLIGCKDSTSEVTPTTITGKWYFESQTGSALLAGKKTDINQINGFDDQGNVYFEFKADGTGNSEDGPFTYTVSGSTLTIKQSGVTTDFTASLPSGKLNLVAGSATLALATNFYNAVNTAKMTNLELAYTLINEKEANIAFGGPLIPSCLVKSSKLSTNTSPNTYTYDADGKVSTFTNASSNTTSWSANKSNFGSDSKPSITAKDANGNVITKYYCNYFGRINRIEFLNASTGTVSQVSTYKYNTDNTVKSVLIDLYQSNDIVSTYLDEYIYENGNRTKYYRTSYNGGSSDVIIPKYLYFEYTYDKLPFKTYFVYPYNIGKVNTNNQIKLVSYNSSSSIFSMFEYNNVYDGKGFVTNSEIKTTSYSSGVPKTPVITTNTYGYECK